MAEELYTMVPKKDAELIGRFIEGKKRRRNKMFNPYVNETDNGRFAFTEKMVEKAKKYCLDNNIDIDFDAMNKRKWNNITLKPNPIP